MADGRDGAGDVPPPVEKTELEEIQFQMNATTDEVGPSSLDPSWDLCRPLMVHIRSSLLVYCLQLFTIKFSLVGLQCPQ